MNNEKENQNDQEFKQFKRFAIWQALTGFVGIGAEPPFGKFKKDDIKKVLKQYLVIGLLVAGAIIGFIVFDFMRTDCQDSYNRTSSLYCHVRDSWEK